MKNATLLLIIFCLLVSCKTINIPEKAVLKQSKYDFDLYAKYLNESSLSYEDKVELTNVLTNLIKTNKEELRKSEKLVVNRKFFIVNDSIKLEYFEFVPKDFNKNGMFFLGNATNVTSNFNELEKLSIETKSKLYVLNYRGYGKSDGYPSFKSLFTDNNLFFNFVEENNPKVNFVIGYSLGTVFATYLAVDNKIDNLILLAPLSNTKDYLANFKKQFTSGLKSLMRPFLKLKTDNFLINISNTDKIKKYDKNLIIFHAKDDEALPYEMGRKVFFECKSTTKEFIKISKGGHSAPFDKNNWEQLIKRLQ